MPECATSATSAPLYKTKPPRPDPTSPLTDAQFAATRLTVRGLGSVAIARHLKLNHHTVGRWKRDPRFVAEVARLRALATEATVEMVGADSSIARHRDPDRRLPPTATTAPVARRDAPRGPSPGAMSAKDRADEAMIERLMRLTRRAPPAPPRRPLGG